MIQAIFRALATLLLCTIVFIALVIYMPLAVLNQSTVQSIANNLRTDWQSLNAITSAYTQQLGNMPFVNFNSGPASSNITSNWSGYAATTTGPYTAVSGRWAIPTVSSSVPNAADA